MCIKNGILRVLFSGRSFIDFQGGALRAPPRENRPLPDVGFERVNRSEINLTEFTDIIEKQEEDRRRDADRRRKERESDLEQFRKLLGDHLS